MVNDRRLPWLRAFIANGKLSPSLASGSLRTGLPVVAMTLWRGLAGRAPLTGQQNHRSPNTLPIGERRGAPCGKDLASWAAFRRPCTLPCKASLGQSSLGGPSLPVAVSGMDTENRNRDR